MVGGTASVVNEAEMNEQDWLACDDSIPMLEFLLAGCGLPFDSVAGEIDSPNE